MKRKSVIRRIMQADAFIHSTFLDSFSYVTLEAMASSKPVIATATGGISETVGIGGILVKPTEKSILKSMIKVYKSKHLRQALSVKASKKAASYDWNIISQKFVKLYQSILL